MRQYINPIRVQRSSALTLRTPINTVTHHDLTRHYCHLISSNVKILTYFCVRGTVSASTHCTASTGVGRGPTGCHISFP